MPSDSAASSLQVIATGPQALIEDLGRPGHAAVGVPHSGAADRAALTLGNRLVGNDETAAGIECLGGGLVVRAAGAVIVAVTGAPGAVWVGDRQVGHNTRVLVPPGAALRLDQPVAGLRRYLCVRGGVAVPPVLGSRATDVLSGLGPAPLRVGDRVPLGAAAHGLPSVDSAPYAALAPAVIDVECYPGPRSDYIDNFSAVLAPTVWTVGAESNRIGVRLQGGSLRQRPDMPRLGSEPVPHGGIQAPPGDGMIAFLADHPTTGGYPIVAILTPMSCDTLGQAVPGNLMRLHLRR